MTALLRNDGNTPRRTPYAPYGLGAHTCLGASTADLLFLIVSAALFHHWQVEMDPADYNLKVAMLPLPAPDDRFRMRLTEVRRMSATRCSATDAVV